ncbi:MAG: hypothetical protein O2931_09840 [Planctomycetota bacterium]|nr:hypothetical protein [Planctomycetota bacterium]MDA1179081.1 hypothetical protein [Planctomycetota bacterium]
MVQAIKWTSAIIATFVCIATSSAVDITWSGGTGNWNGTNWNAGVTAASITGFTRGDGRINDKFIVNGAGAIVNYSLDGEGGGFRPRQGVSYEIKNGALFSVNAAAAGLEALPTELDVSTLEIDGGTFRRQGRTDDEGFDLGGGALVLGSFRSDDRIGQGVPALGTPAIQVNLSNGGKLDNEGQLWFGSLTDHHPSLNVQVQVNGGTIDLHGGNVPPAGSDISADLLFTYSGSGS